jgi:AraC-like DNA-binding protein
MKPQLLKISTNLVHSFSARKDTVPYINNRWHYHPEVELIHFKEGNGTQFIGDSIKRFRSGDVVMVGAHLPHYWKFDDIYFDENVKTSANVSVIHFSESFWGETFLQLPENKLIKQAVEKARRGIAIQYESAEQIGKLVDDTVDAEGSRKIIMLMEALLAIGSLPEIQQLSSIGFRHQFEQAENDRINTIYDYSMANFKRKIQMEEIASVANISPNSFCRYFKSRTRKTYSQFINEIRIGHACKLLIENQVNVKQICYESGFYNFASFHKYFRQITGKSPLVYQREFLDKKQ